MELGPHERVGLAQEEEHGVDYVDVDGIIQAHLSTIDAVSATDHPFRID